MSTLLVSCPGCKSEMAQTQKNCLQCGTLNPFADHIGCFIIGGIIILPIIFAWFTLRPGVSKSTKQLAFMLFAFQLIVVILAIGVIASI